METKIIRDVWGTATTELAEKKLFLFDMDGTVYKEEKIFDGTLDLLSYIEEIGGKYVFITNNSSRSVADYIRKVKGMGIQTDADHFFTSTQATVRYLRKHFPGRRIYCQGTHSLIEELKNSGICVTEQVEDDVDMVLVGFDTELTSAKLRKTCELLQRGIPFVATNPDLRCPVSFGFIPDCGAICNMIEAATERKPVYIGKPEPVMVHSVREKYGYKPEETAVIGDRLYTDIAAGLNAGVMTVCVLTGETTKDDIKKSDIKPKLTFESVKELFWALKFGRYHRLVQADPGHSTENL